MTPQNLFNIILKIFGLFFLREIIYIIPQLISVIPSFVEADDFGRGQSASIEILPLMVILIAIAFYFFIIYQLLFKTNRIIDKLKLDKASTRRNFLSIFQVP